MLISHKKRLYDIPDRRKIHTTPIPRLGGLSFFPVILITVFGILGGIHLLGYEKEFVPPPHFEYLYGSLFVIAGCTLLYLVGVMDDLIGVGYKKKFLVQFIAALPEIFYGIWFNSLAGIFGIWDIPACIGIPLTILFVVFVTNAINFIDGIDGLASGLCSIALIILGLMCALQKQFYLALLAFTSFGVIIPFWFYNVYGNAKRGHKLFMGDSGCLTLGFIISMLIIQLSKKEVATGSFASYNLLLALSTIIVPAFDVVRLVLHRLRAGKNPFLPDKNHIHHKLLRIGISQHAVMFILLGLALFFIILNFLLLNIIPSTAIVITDIVLWTAMHLMLNGAIKKYEMKINNGSQEI